MNYQIQQVKPSDDMLVIVGLPSDADEDNKTYLFPGLYHSLESLESMHKAIFHELYDTYQTHDGIKEGDTFEVVPFTYEDYNVPAYKFQCVSFEVVEVQ